MDLLGFWHLFVFSFYHLLYSFSSIFSLYNFRIETFVKILILIFSCKVVCVKTGISKPTPTSNHNVYCWVHASIVRFKRKHHQRHHTFLNTSKGYFIQSYYGRRLRGHWFPPMRLQETKNLASRPFTLEAKVQRPSSYMVVLYDSFFDQSNILLKEVWVT